MGPFVEFTTIQSYLTRSKSCSLNYDCGAFTRFATEQRMWLGILKQSVWPTWDGIMRVSWWTTVAWVQINSITAKDKSSWSNDTVCCCRIFTSNVRWNCPSTAAAVLKCLAALKSWSERKNMSSSIQKNHLAKTMRITLAFWNAEDSASGQIKYLILKYFELKFFLKKKWANPGLFLFSFVFSTRHKSI